MTATGSGWSATVTGAPDHQGRLQLDQPLPVIVEAALKNRHKQF